METTASASPSPLPRVEFQVLCSVRMRPATDTKWARYAVNCRWKDRRSSAIRARCFVAVDHALDRADDMDRAASLGIEKLVQRVAELRGHDRSSYRLMIVAALDDQAKYMARFQYTTDSGMGEP